MRKFLPFALSLVALAALGAGVAMQPGTRFEFTNCAVVGSLPQSIPGGQYIFRVAEADTRVCINPTANPDAGTSCGLYDGGMAGELFPSGTVMLLTVPGSASTTKSVSCSSSTATGDLHFTYAP